MSDKAAAEDLLVLARQCKLSEDQERRFELAVQSSRELECLYDAGLHFDDEAGLESGDEVRFGRLVAGTLARLDQAHRAAAPGSVRGAHPAAARPSRAASIARYFAASLALGLLLCVGLASAWDYVEKRAAQAHERELSARAAASRRVTPQPAFTAPTLPVAPEPLPVVASAQPAFGAKVPTAHGLPSAAAESRPSAAELFARANELRRNGDIEAAITLYERLNREHPRSTEAEDAKVLSGNLLLSQRSPRAALRQFEEYHSAALSLEALWGQAQALKKLNSPDESMILNQLMRDYPESPYAAAARNRLRELNH